MTSGLKWKKNEDETLERFRKFFTRRMQDSILVTLPVNVVPEKLEEKWQAFDARWGTYIEDEDRPFPSNAEIFDRTVIGVAERSQVEDDWLPVMYSTLDLGEGMVSAMFDNPIRYIHRKHAPVFSFATPKLRSGYEKLEDVKFSLDSRWSQRLLSIIEYFEQYCSGNFAQHNFLTMDAMNFAVEMRGATQAYTDIYEFPEELARLMEIGLNFNIRLQEAQCTHLQNYKDGCFVWLAGWVPFERAVSMSVDAHVMCSVKNYLEFGFEYNQRLLAHFGHATMHFHCNRPDLAKEVARLPGLELFQYGAGLPNGPADYTFLPAMRAAVGDIPIQVSYPLDRFEQDLDENTLMPNVWYHLYGEYLTVDQANYLMDKVRKYQC